jgi:hypothetical protein
MRKILLAFATAVLGSTAGAGTGGTEAPEPVNVIAETGLDVGPCGDGGSLSYPPAPYKGSAYFLRKADNTLAARHEGLTKQRAPWLHRLDGPSGTNRLYTGANGDRAIVFWSCKAGDCGANMAYGAYGLQSTDYLLQVQEGGKVQSIGSSSAPLAAAIACVRAQDDRRRGRTAEQVKTPSGQ